MTVSHEVSVTVIVADRHENSDLFAELAHELAGMSEGCVAWEQNTEWKMVSWNS